MKNMGVRCINCGWENPANSITCEKCNQPLSSQVQPPQEDTRPEENLSLTSTKTIRDVEDNVVLNNRYELIALTQSWENSELWLAKDLYTQRNISIIIPPRENYYLNQKILKEYNFLSNIKINGALTPLHYDMTQERSFFIVPQISSVLTSYIGEIDFDMVERFFLQLANVLATSVILKKGIGNICPANILVSPSSSLHLTSSAFVSLYQSSTDTTLTGDAQEHESYIPYLAPEYFSSSHQSFPSVKGDIWAMGATIYELITGQRPFDKNGGGGQLNGDRLNSRFYFHSTVENDYTRLNRLQYLVYRCLEQNPTDRPTPAFIRSSLLIKTVKSEKRGRLYGLILPPIGVIYSIECDSLSEFSAQSIPGQGPFPHISSFFMGAFFEDGDECGYLKLEDNGQIIEYSRMSKEHYKHLCQLT